MTDTELCEEIKTTAPGWRLAVSAELHRIEDACAGGARGQSEAARMWRAVNLGLGAAAVLTAGVAGSLVLATGSLDRIAGGLALGSALLTAIISMVGPGRRENQATEAAKAYQAIQTVTRQACQVDLPGQPFDQARRALADLTERWHGVDRAAVPVPRRARPPAPAADQETLDQMMNVFRVSPSL
jgi:hypothetical protein